jgi:hypothetical protein
MAGDAHHAAHGLHNDVISRSCAVRAGLPETGDRSHNQARVVLFQHTDRIPSLGQNARPEILDKHITSGKQLLEDDLVRRGFEAERTSSAALMKAGWSNSSYAKPSQGYY